MGNAFLQFPGFRSTQPNRTYSGPDIPTAYDPNWQLYNNLSPAQVAWFQSQPEWQNFKAYVALSPTTAMPATPIATVNAALATAAASKAKIGN